MLRRWDIVVENLNLFVRIARKFVKKACSKLRKKRGRPPKHNIEDYLTLIIAKEEDKKTLRGAEARLSKNICDARVDHSVIAYWENKPEVEIIVANVIEEIGIKLQRLLGYEFSMLDSTKFSNWHHDEVEFHVTNRILKGVVYPVGTSLITTTVHEPVEEATPLGEGNLYADAWYDDNKSMGVLFNKGYTPIICPNKNRWRGYWRKKARKLYRNIKNRYGYRQRGRGESIFGSLTNEYGDRIKTLTVQATRIRSLVRIVAHQVKLLMRILERLVRILRHAPNVIKKEKPRTKVLYIRCI